VAEGISVTRDVGGMRAFCCCNKDRQAASLKQLLSCTQKYQVLIVCVTGCNRYASHMQAAALSPYLLDFFHREPTTPQMASFFRSYT
jgi:hypothetical protein